MRKFFAIAGLLLAMLCASASAHALCANTSPAISGGGNVFGAVVSQWKQYFAAKIDANNGCANNLTVTGTLSLTYQQVISALGFVPVGAGNSVPVMLGTSVNNPATGTLESLLPVQTVTGASKTFAPGDLFKKTRRSNAGSAMTDTLPASTATGMNTIGGAWMHLYNADASASDTITAGAGTTISGASSYVLLPGRDIWISYDLANTEWRFDGNTNTALLTTQLGTGVQAALGINTGSSGAFVVNGGTLGTPSSGTATYLTGLPLGTGVSGTLPAANMLPLANGDIYMGNGSNQPAASAIGGTVIAPHVATEAALATSTIAQYPNGVWRDDYSAGLGAPPLWYKQETGTCSANSRVSDGGSCVNETSSNSFYAVFPTAGVDPREFGAKFDGSTDDSVADYAATTYMESAKGGGTLLLPGGKTTCVKTAQSGNFGFVLVGSQPVKLVGGSGWSIGLSGSVISTCGANIGAVWIDGPIDTAQDFAVIGKGYGENVSFGATYPAFKITQTNGSPAKITNVNAAGGSYACSITAGNTLFTNFYCFDGYSGELYVNGDGNTFDVAGVDRAWPVVLPVEGSTPVNAWAASTYYGAVGNCTVSSTTLTCTPSSGSIKIGQEITCSCAVNGAQVLSGTGPWTISISGSLGSTAMTFTGDVLTTQGYVIQVSTNGTSGGSAPALANFGFNITDGTAVEKLVSGVGQCGIEFDTGGAENIIRDSDLSVDEYYNFCANNFGSGLAPNYSLLSGDTLSLSINGAVYLAANASEIKLSDNHMFSSISAGSGQAIIAAAAFLGPLLSHGNTYIGNNVAGSAALNLAGGKAVSDVDSFSGWLTAMNVGGATEATLTNGIFSNVTNLFTFSSGGTSCIITNNNSGKTAAAPSGSVCTNTTVSGNQ